MTKKTILSFLLITASIVKVAHAAMPTAYDELNDAQKSALQSGQQIYFDQKVDGSPWPKMFLYQRVDGTPEEAAAATMDWELRPAYTSNLKSAKISKIGNPAEVDYVLSVPVLGDEPFTLSNLISAYDGGGSYRIDWHLLRAKRTKKPEGFTRFEALGTGTLMAITNFIDPGSSLASLITDTAIRQFKDAASGFVAQVAKERQGDPALLRKQILALHVALGH